MRQIDFFCIFGDWLINLIGMKSVNDDMVLQDNEMAFAQTIHALLLNRARPLLIVV